MDNGNDAGAKQGKFFEEEDASLVLTSTSNGNGRDGNVHSTPTLGREALEALRDQQDAMDTVRAANRRGQSRNTTNYDGSSSSDGSGELRGLNYNNNNNLEDLFRAPFAPPSQDSETIEFQEPGVIDFRAALLAEQLQQQGILEERQRIFDVGGNGVVNGDAAISPIPTTSIMPPLETIESPASNSSPTKSPSHRPTKSILKTTDNNNNNSPNNGTGKPPSIPPPLRPVPINSSSRVRSVPALPLGASSNTGTAGQHTRTVSWSLEKLAASIPSRLQGVDDSLKYSTNSNNNPSMAAAASGRPAAGRGHRQRLLSEENGHSLLTGRRIDIHDIAGITPFESEAETNILRAVEDFGLSHGLSDSLSCLSNLPDGFTLPLPEEEGERPTTSVPTSNEYRSSSPRHQRRVSELSTGSAKTNRTPRQEPPMSASQHGGGLQVGEHSPGRMRAAAMARSQRVAARRPRMHRHTQSVEQTLFGLTAQLSRLDGEALRRMKDDGWDEDSDADDSFAGDASEDEAKAAQNKDKGKHRRMLTSSADRLAGKAQALVNNALQARHGRKASTLPTIRPTTPTDIEAQPASIDPATGLYIDNSNKSRRSRKNSRTIDPATGLYIDDSNESRRRNKIINTNLEDELDVKGSFSSHSLNGGQMSPPSSADVSPMQNHESTIEEGNDEASSIDDNEGVGTTANTKKKRYRQKKERRKAHRFSIFRSKDRLAENVRDDWQTFEEFLSPRKKHIHMYCKTLLFFVIMPATGIAAIFFYVLENRKTGGDATEEAIAQADVTKASVSWWILFVGVRQVVTLSLAIATQSFVIDFIVLGSHFSLKLLGPVITLLVVQSKGW